MKSIEDEQYLVKIENFLSNKELININDKNYKKIIFLYESALKEIKTKVDILEEELKHFYDYNPIEHISTRIKDSESIINKLNRKKSELTYQNMIEKLNDIAGIRIVCSFRDDIYKIAEQIENFHDIKIVSKKDYVKKPKKNGYMSYHMIVEIPVNFLRGLIYVKVEIQIRTMGMDFWAGLEHKINYKELNKSKKHTKELMKYAELINNIDSKMLIMSNQKLEYEKQVAKNNTIETGSNTLIIKT